MQFRVFSLALVAVTTAEGVNFTDIYFDLRRFRLKKANFFPAETNDHSGSFDGINFRQKKNQKALEHFNFYVSQPLKNNDFMTDYKLPI